MKKGILIFLITAPLAFGLGFVLSRTSHQSTPSFHDIRVNPIQSYVGLIQPESPEIASLVRGFRTLEDAYLYVRDEIEFDPTQVARSPDEILRAKRSSCLGKATLLASIYRAMGLPAEKVRVVKGSVTTPKGPAEHIWVDMEYDGRCLQQDPSGLLGKFAFFQYPDNAYVNAHVFEESFCFNDQGFAMISQLNRMMRK